VKNAFDDAGVDDETVSSYLAELLINWRQADAKLHRTASLIALIAATFELFTRGAVTEISFASLKITKDLPLIFYSLPVVAAYLTLNLMILLSDIAILSQVHASLTRIRLPTLYANNMEIPLQPPGGLLPASRFRLGNRNSYTGRIVLIFIRLGFYLAIPALFLVYAYFRLFSENGDGNIFVWVSLILSSILLLASALLLISMGPL
jgi:hypothetical protein